MPENDPKCSHCGGKLLKDEDGRKCLQCGRLWRTNSEVAEFYDSHKKEILADIADMGRPKTGKKWQIPSPSITGLLKRWLGEKPLGPKPAPERSDNHHGPELPAFSNDWTPEVQMKWLETWASRR